MLSPSCPQTGSGSSEGGKVGRAWYELIGDPLAGHIANKTDISYLKTSRVFFYINYRTEGCAQQQVSLS